MTKECGFVHEQRRSNREHPGKNMNLAQENKGNQTLRNFCSSSYGTALI